MKTLDELKEHLIEYYGCSQKDYEDNSLFLANDLGLDSLDHMELMQWCETKYNIGINSYSAEDLVTLHQLADFIDNRRCECFTNAQRKYCKNKNCNV